MRYNTRMCQAAAGHRITCAMHARLFVADRLAAHTAAAAAVLTGGVWRAGNICRTAARGGATREHTISDLGHVQGDGDGAASPPDAQLHAASGTTAQRGWPAGIPTASALFKPLSRMRLTRNTRAPCTAPSLWAALWARAAPASDRKVVCHQGGRECSVVVAKSQTGWIHERGWMDSRAAPPPQNLLPLLAQMLTAAMRVTSCIRGWAHRCSRWRRYTSGRADTIAREAASTMAGTRITQLRSMDEGWEGGGVCGRGGQPWQRQVHSKARIIPEL